MIFARTLLLSAIVASVASAIDISFQCKSTLIAVAASSDAKCLSASFLSGLIFQGGDTSIISTIDGWLQEVCNEGPCSNASLASVMNSLTSGCSAEMSTLLGSVSSSDLTSMVQEGYPTVRKIGCLQDTTVNDESCVTQTLTNIQSTTGTLSLNEISSLVSTVAGGGTVYLPQNTTCSSCAKEAFNLANTDFPSQIGSRATEIQGVCGAAFTDGSTPSGIVQTDSNTTLFGASTSSTGDGSSLSSFQALISSVLAGSLVLAVVV